MSEYKYPCIKFRISGKPQGKARARTTKYGSYTPEKTVLYENYIKLCYQNESSYISAKPLYVYIYAFLQIPKNTPKKYIKDMEIGNIRPIKKPDIDNIAKVILDALNGIAYKDDTQVIGLTVAKMYARNPFVEVTIQEVGD
ncbi:MAG: RusA family crossover junction endodeoxyribonuclease [Mobilitalea sp.]